jgi:hypothetical protein
VSRKAKVIPAHRLVRGTLKGVTPSKNAATYVAHQLRTMQHQAMSDAIVCERAGAQQAARSLRLQSDDIRQVAQFLEAMV